MQRHPGDGRCSIYRRRLVCREWRRSPESTPLESLSTDSRPPFERGWVRSIEPTISIGRRPAGKSSIRKVECRIRKLASTMPKVGCGKRKLKGQMLNVGCEKVNVHPTELEGRIRKLDCCLSWMSKAKTWMLHKSKLNVGCKKSWIASTNSNENVTLNFGGNRTPYSGYSEIHFYLKYTLRSLRYMWVGLTDSINNKLEQSNLTSSNHRSISAFEFS